MDRPRGIVSSPGSEALRGRAATREELRAELARASAGYISGALDNPRLSEPEVLLILLNRRASPEQLQRVARDGRWRRSRAVARRIVLHPGTPPNQAQQMLEHLGWKDLADVGVASTAHPRVRRRAEEMLLVRVEAMSLGERVALARTAGRRVIGNLAQSGDEAVLVSLLGNGRLVEADAVRLASSPTAPPGFLRRLAQHPDWSTRRRVRVALVQHPRTPVAVALRLTERLSVADLRRLVNDAKVPQIVKVGASRILERGRGGRPEGAV